jgi:hypothetical protein
LEDRDVLLTVAEIAAAFAGFATLAAVFTSGRGHDSEEQVAVRFQTLLIYSLATIGFCFVPFIPLWYGYSSESIWYVSTWLLASGIACINIWMALRNRAAVAKVSKFLLIPWILAVWAPVVVAGLSLIGVGTNAANYRVALLATLFISASAFVRVIASLSPISRESQ